VASFDSLTDAKYRDKKTKRRRRVQSTSGKIPEKRGGKTKRITKKGEKTHSFKAKRGPGRETERYWTNLRY